MTLNAGTEKWDDGNTQSGDGWSSTWTVDTGYSWTGGTPTSADTWVIVCGDGIIISPETWDDWNAVGDDGCSSTWTIETGINWTRIGSNAWQNCGAIWGDSKKVTRYEQWEDGNTVNGDGWDSSCHIENGYYWSGGTLIRVDTWIPVWGDGKKLPIEEWDDKNLNNGDGCSSTCKIEYGFYWTGGSMTQVDVWKEIWGDGVVIGDKANKYLKFFNFHLLSELYIKWNSLPTFPSELFAFDQTFSCLVCNNSTNSTSQL